MCSERVKERQASQKSMHAETREIQNVNANVTQAVTAEKSLQKRAGVAPMVQ